MSDQPQPVLNTAAIAGVITALATGLGTIGFTNAETKLSGAATALAGIVVAVVVLAGHVLAALHVRQQVTPIANPKDGAGRPLVPVDGAYQVTSLAPATLSLGNASMSAGQSVGGFTAELGSFDAGEDYVPEGPEPADTAPSPPHAGRAEQDASLPSGDVLPSGRHAAPE